MHAAINCSGPCPTSRKRLHSLVMSLNTSCTLPVIGDEAVRGCQEFAAIDAKMSVVAWLGFEEPMVRQPQLLKQAQEVCMEVLGAQDHVLP